MNREEFVKQLIISKYGNIKNFSELIDVPYTTIRSILERGIGKAGIDNIIKICKGLGISPEQLSNDFTFNESITGTISTMYLLKNDRQHKVYDYAESQLKEQKQEIKQKNSPITSLEQFRKKKEEETIYSTTKWIGAVSAGTGEFLTDETCEEIELPIEQIPDEADFCLSVNGDSMEPIFHNDDYVFVKRQLDIYSGNIGVVIVNGESFLKRIWFENNFVRLESFNKKYKDIIITENDEFRIVGKVVM